METYDQKHSFYTYEGTYTFTTEGKNIVRFEFTCATMELDRDQDGYGYQDKKTDKFTEKFMGVLKIEDNAFTLDSKQLPQLGHSTLSNGKKETYTTYMNKTED